MLSGAGIQAVARILVLIVLARLLEPREFGLVGAAMVVINLALMFAELGLRPALVQRAILAPRHLHTAFTTSIILGGFFGLLLILAAPVIASFFRLEQLQPIIKVIALIFPIYSLTFVAEAMLERELQFRLLAMVNIISYLVGFGMVGISLAFLGFGVWALVVARLASGATVATALLLVQPHPKRPRWDWQSFKELMAFGGGFTLGRIFNNVARQGDNLVVGRFLGSEALGLYGRAYQLLVFPTALFGNVLDKVLFPSMAKIQNDPKRLELVFRRGVTLLALLFAPISVVLLVLPPELILVLLGPKWLEVTLPFQILAIGMLFRASYKMSDSLARATGAVYRGSWRQAAYAFFVLTGAWVGQHWGIAGVGGGVVLALALHFLLMADLSLRLTSLTWKGFFAAHVPALIIGLFTLVEVSLIAAALRSFAMPAPVVVVVSICSVGLVQLTLIRTFPGLLLGADGRWFDLPPIVVPPVMLVLQPSGAGA